MGISIDNGHTFITAEEVLERYSLDFIANYMDDDIREELHNSIAPCSDLEFLESYLQRADIIIG